MLSGLIKTDGGYECFDQANQQPTTPTMKITMKSKFLHILCAAVATMALPASAAVITWGSVQTITGASDIISTGVTALAGADFGITTGTTTTVNNGSVDVDFESMRSGQSDTLSNGITVAVAAGWINFGPNGGITATPSITGNFETILNRNIGIEPPDSAATENITLSGLVNGTTYQIQAFVDSTGTNGQTISGSATMNSLPGQYVVGTFTADSTSQVLSVTTTSGGFGVINALTIGTVIPEPSTALLGALGLLGLLRRRRN